MVGEYEDQAKLLQPNAMNAFEWFPRRQGNLQPCFHIGTQPGYNELSRVPVLRRDTSQMICAHRNRWIQTDSKVLATCVHL